MLIFPLKKEWYEKIKAGKKKVEYREVKPYWETRLWKSGCLPSIGSPYNYDNFKDWFPPVCCVFQLGYNPQTRLGAFIRKVEIVDGSNTDLHVNRLVYAIHFTGIQKCIDIKEW